MSAETVVSPPIAVYLRFDSQPDPAAVTAMKQEMENIYGSTGLKLTWRSLDEAEGNEVFSDLYVLRFRGRCRADRFSVVFSELGFYGGAVVLGSSDTVEGRILPFGALECESVRKSLERQLAAAAKTERPGKFGKALGRVAAHELFHMMTGKAKHGTRGIFRASFRGDELSADGFDFDEEERSELKRIAQRPAVLP